MIEAMLLERADAAVDALGLTDEVEDSWQHPIREAAVCYQLVGGETLVVEENTWAVYDHEDEVLREGTV